MEKHVHFIGGRYYAINGPVCEPITGKRGERGWETLLRITRGSTGLLTFGQFSDEWLTGVEYALRPFGYYLAPSARQQIGADLKRAEEIEYANV